MLTIFQSRSQIGIRTPTGILPAPILNSLNSTEKLQVSNNPDDVLQSIKNNANSDDSILVLQGINPNQLSTYIVYQWYRTYLPNSKLLLVGVFFNPLLYSELPVLSFPNIDNITVHYHHRNFGFQDITLFDELRRVISSLVYSTVGEQGPILVFLPSSREIQTLKKLEPNYLTLDDEDAQLLPKKVLLVSSISELTGMDGIFSAVVDTLQEIGPSLTKTGAILPQIRYVSAATANQRARLANPKGNTAEGICYRMATESFFKRFPPLTSPDILALPLDRVLLTLAAYNLPLTLPGRSLELTLANLQRWSLIQDGKLTDLGARVLELPLSIPNGIVLEKWIQTGNPIFPCLCALSLIDGYTSGYYWYPLLSNSAARSLNSNTVTFEDFQDVYVAEYNYVLNEHAEAFFKEFMGKSDLATLLNLWSDFLAKTGGTVVEDKGYDTTEIVQWCQNRSLSLRQIQATLGLLRNLISNLKQQGLTVDTGPFTTEGVLNGLRPLFQEVYPSLERQDDGQSFSYTDGWTVYYLNPLINRSYIIADPPKQILPLLVTSVVLGDDLEVVNYVTLAVDVE